MKNQLLCLSCDESRTTEDNEEYLSRSIAPSSYFWWRSGAKINNETILKLDSCSGKSAAAEAGRRVRVVRELERLALMASHHEGGLTELRHKLLMYRSGDFWMPTGGITKDNMDIPPLATILLVGFSASGKTSLVNLMYSVLGRSGLLIPFSPSSKPSRTTSTIISLKEHNVVRSLRSGFCVFDSRGFQYHQIQMADEQQQQQQQQPGSSTSVEELVSSWMTNGVRHNQVCGFIPGDPDEDHHHHANVLMQHDNYMKSSSKFVTRRVNCVMVVVNMAEIYKAFQAGDYKPMEATRQLFCSFTNRSYDENPILILTHGDMLSTEERIEGRLKICECLGVSESSGAVYDIVCLTEYGFPAEESDPVSAYALAEAVYRALLLSDRSHSPKKMALDWALLISSWIMCFLASVFAFLAHICIKLGQRRHTN